MRVFIVIFFLFCSFNSFSQNLIQTHYFLINKKDTLIKKQIATKTNKYEGYVVINENKIVNKILRSSKISGDDIEYRGFEELSFAFNREHDTIVDKSFLNKLNIIRNRKDFFNKNKVLDETKSEFIFIEPISCSKFILRKVRPIIFE